MVEHGVTEAAMESTAVYWVPVWNELCESMDLKLVNHISSSSCRGARAMSRMHNGLPNAF